MQQLWYTLCTQLCLVQAYLFSFGPHTLCRMGTMSVPKFDAAFVNPSTFRTRLLSVYPSVMPPRTVPPIGLGGVASLRKVQGETVMGTRRGGRGLRGDCCDCSTKFAVFVCVCGVHFVLAAHVVALNCGKLSTQQAGWPHVACGMWHDDWKDSEAFTSICGIVLFSHFAFRTVHANLCLILAIKPLGGHTLQRIESRATRIH